MTDNPSAIFFWKDWQNDEKLKPCSLAAKGLWMEMLCVCAKNGGYLLVNGKPATLDQICRQVGGFPDEVHPLLDELEMNGVFSRTRAEVIYSRRMIRAAKTSETNRKNGSAGGQASVRKQKGIFQSPERTAEQPLERLPSEPPSEVPSPPYSKTPSSPYSPPPYATDGGKTVDRIRSTIWRLHGLTEDQIATKLASASREGLEQVVRWLKAGWTESEVTELASASYDAADQTSKPIRNPWTYLDAAVKTRSKTEPDTAPLASPAAEPTIVDGDPARWRGRLERFKSGSGFWANGWGPKPDEPGCLAPSDLLAEFGYGENQGKVAVSTDKR